MSTSISMSTQPKLPKRDRSAPVRPPTNKSTNSNGQQQQTVETNNNGSTNQSTPSYVNSTSHMPKIKTPEVAPSKPLSSPTKFSMSQPLTDASIIRPIQRHPSHSVSTNNLKPSTNQSTNESKTQSSTSSSIDPSTVKDADLADESTNQSTTPQSRVLVHQQPMLETLRELVRAQNVGHWKGLNTTQRKDIAVALCKEHLFNPQSAKAKDSRTIVTWSINSSLIDYDIWVKCIKRTEPYYQGKVFLTEYTAHFNQSGALVDFDEKHTETVKNCVIM